MSILKKQNKKELVDLDLIKDDCMVVDYDYFKYNSEKYNGFGYLSPEAAILQWPECCEKIETLLNNNKRFAASIILDNETRARDLLGVIFADVPDDARIISAEYNISKIYSIRLTIYFGKVKVMAIYFNFNSEYIDDRFPIKM